MAKIHANSHTVSGNLAKDAELQALQFPVDGQPMFRFKFRIGCDSFTRDNQGQPAQRTTWFTIRFDVREKGVKFYQRLLKKGAEVLVVGEQLVDTVVDDRGTQYYHYMAAQTVAVLTEAKIREEQNAQTSTPRPNAPVRTGQAPRLKAVPQPQPKDASMPPPPGNRVLADAPVAPEPDPGDGKRRYEVAKEDLKEAIHW
ncbi:single-stranded DNA-binding protein [Rhodanobacter sp. B2A1Ga4]|uniref:single-stranded DNA-binding protein n=1 Tax=Rhodanobacter sp. B2A1Ga4 TaxID=2778647 RepID=UPI001B391EA7|nr:single-stranded DNA-binding protein [Rhodanobacter sp. B2A1Ga4]MBQ4855912.1 single-stranded DNA-binding protein [Rhodanobacter sp. B2A1Ga4]